MCSKWTIAKKERLSSGTLTTRWESLNCRMGTVTIHQIGSKFFGRDSNGMLVSQFGENSFDQIRRTMEATFVLSVRIGEV